MMTMEWTALGKAIGMILGVVGFVRGGLHFRRWSVEGRIGVPRFPNHVETVLLWLVYSSGVSTIIILVLQVMRHL